MLADRYGLLLSTTSAAARDAYVAGYDCVLSANAGGEAHLAGALSVDAAFALGHAAMARAYFVVANVAEARKSAARARELAEKATARERSHVNALCLAIEGKPVDAFAATREHLRSWPRDAMVAAPATGVFGLIGFSGRQGREPEQLEFLDALESDLGGDWWFDSVRAFALEECGRLADAQALIERSMAANPRNAHGAHIKAHVLYETGEDAAALAYLDAWMPAYPREALLHCHLSWHVAMFSLALGQAEKAWRIYERQVHPGGSWGPAINAVTDATAFLWRAELAGQSRRPALWAKLSSYAQESFPKTGISFVDMHAAVARSVSGGDAVGIIAELRERDAKGKLPAGSVVYRLAEGFQAYMRGDWGGAISIFEAALPETVRIGGSRAQRDLVEYTLLAAYLKSGRADQAKALIVRRTDRRPRVPVAGYAV
ncbi:MAG: tetratricopeptide repeat protein [Betaproteobacteria bacterium]|nr:tetratricopeptide repeat protein [Betaproteobacteria bacterium]